MMLHARPDARPGTYALVLRTTTTAVVAIGRRHALPLAPGWMVYAGSAFGPGGVAARVAHHRRRADRPHWHIDALRRWWSNGSHPAPARPGGGRSACNGRRVGRRS